MCDAPVPKRRGCCHGSVYIGRLELGRLLTDGCRVRDARKRTFVAASLSATSRYALTPLGRLLTGSFRRSNRIKRTSVDLEALLPREEEQPYRQTM